ncbi:MAG: sulfite exporter TauE/SafE family protein, partial [Chloroflexi bacterium]|nr:sulfite exporter TauE/SafE family protein [Chloroflexota bacterium]
LYMLAMGLPKMEFIGTSAWYFLALNLFKVPFNYSLGLVTASSLALDLRIAPFAILGAFAGRLLIRYVDQKVFENLALVFTAAAGIKLLL